MGKRLDKEIMIGPSLADASGKLGFAGCFGLFMDIAAEHAEELGMGQSSLSRKGLFWITAKSRIRFYRRPFMTERAVISTWPESHKSVRCTRDYRLSGGGETLAEGMTQWAVMDVAKGRPVDIGGMYPDDFDIPGESLLTDGFSRIEADFSGEPFAAHTVSSNDIDLGGHMNNVAYIRALLNVFSTEQLKSMKLSEMEIQYLKPCFEGERLDFRRAAGENGTLVQGSVGDRVSVLFRLR